MRCRIIATGLLALVLVHPATAQERGYYRFPAIHGETIVFTAEGDLWKTSLRGGAAMRLTTHLAEETNAAISPDGKTIAYTARYEGPAEVYTIPIEGGSPKQLSWEGIGATVVGWTPDGKVLYATRRYSTLPNTQMVAVDPRTNDRKLIPLAQAADGSYNTRGTLFFTRLPWQGSYTKRYQGGTVQNLWRWAPSDAEASPLTADFKGTSKNPMWWNGRVYFASDRDGIMNIWSMDENGRDLKQHTTHKDYDVQTPALHDGRIVYQQGADLHVLELRPTTVLAKASTGAARLDITMASDLDHLRDRWVKRPMEWISDYHISPNGDRITLISRGQMFVAPVGAGGRTIEFTESGTRYREAHFLDSKSLIVLSDKSGEVELWKMAADGRSAPEQFTRDAKILRWDAFPSPDGKYIAHYDKNQKLWLYDVSAKRDRELAQNKGGLGFGYSGIANITWSPDSKLLAWSEPVSNMLTRVAVYDIEKGTTTPVTTDRYDSYNPAFTSDGAWLFFLSDRTFNSSQGSPWGSRQPEPYYDDQTRIYAVQLKPGAKWPFAPKTELDSTAAAATTVGALDLRGAITRLYEVRVPAGNYNSLAIAGNRLFYGSREERNRGGKLSIQSLELKTEAKPEEFTPDVTTFEISADGKKMLFRKGMDLYVVNVAAKAPANLTESRVDLSGWTFALDRKEELQSLFVDAWRLERDYFYDPNMHGVDWRAMRTKYAPLAARVTDRSELNDVVAQMVGELSALHIFVRGGDLRAGQDTIVPAGLGAVLEKDAANDGWRVQHIYRTDPDIPEELSPLARPGVEVSEGDVIVAINGTPTLSVDHPAILLQNRAGKQVLLRVRTRAGSVREVVAVAINMGRENDLRYDEWEYTRRLAVDSISGGKVGYVHLRAMGPGNMAEFTREYYPVFNRDALIVDMRNNSGGNIDSWVLEKLIRRPWFYWAPRAGEPYWNMPFAFRGPMVTLVNEWSASDGEAFPEGFRRLGLGRLIGTRTWGGEIWLSSSNALADRGIATAAEVGVYGPDGEWLIEGPGVTPDVVVDNPPRAAFDGRDAQLEAAVKAMVDEVRARPNPVPTVKGYRK